MELSVAPHPLLVLRAFVTEFPTPLGKLPRDTYRELLACPSGFGEVLSADSLLRFESPAHHAGRYVVRQDVTVHGTKLPEGSVMLFLLASANRDERRFNDGDTFDIHRNVGRHLTFGNGIHLCMGAALARLEGCIALDEVLTRFPEWEIDLRDARLSPTSTVRGWETLPARIG